MRILVIEDDPETANFIAMGLRDAGHEVDQAATVPDGLAKAITVKPHVAIVDHSLPRLDGLALLIHPK